MSAHCVECGTRYPDGGHPLRCLKQIGEGMDLTSCGGLVIADTTEPTALQRQVGGDHYKGDVIQHVEYCQKNKITWCEAAAIKYIIRHRKKNGVQDINKAIHYLELLKQIEYPNQ